jgi:hypothetical protein
MYVGGELRIKVFFSLDTLDEFTVLARIEGKISAVRKAGNHTNMN